MKLGIVLGSLPVGLRGPLLGEYQEIVRNYTAGRWTPSELSGGKFCEIVFTVLEGYAAGYYSQSPQKPRDFVRACRKLEQNSHVPRSFQILIPRILPAIYEVRNNRGVGHSGGEVDSNLMDATFVVNNSSWVLAELIRVYHNVSVDEAQAIVETLTQRRVPLIWEGTSVRRVLDPKLNLRCQILALLATSSGRIATSDLLLWTEYQNHTYFKKLLRDMHSQRLLELSDNDECVEILPPGDAEAAEIIKSATEGEG